MIFVSEQSISLDRMAGVLTDCPRQKLKELLAELELDYQQRGGALEIVQVANGYQFRTRAEFAPWLGRLRQQKFARLSRAALETLAIVAYRQPVTRAEAESIRGVDSGAVLGTLLERRLIRILGRKEVAGRPILYGTTQDFLELFGLKSLKDLPTLREIKDMVDTTRQGPESQEGRSEDFEDGTGEEESEERAGPSAEEGAAVSEHRDAVASAKKRYESESDLDFEEEWLGDEESPEEEEITPGELDEILKSTRTRLELYEADEEVEEETGPAGPAEAQGEQGADEPGEGGDPDED
jgi:segregation and condensation protein B